MDVETVAHLLAGEHAAEDPDMREVWWHPDDGEVRLIEVSAAVPDRGRILPFRYAPDPPDVPYPSLIVLVGPGDWEKVLAQGLELPTEFASRKLERILGNRDAA